MLSGKVRITCLIAGFINKIIKFSQYVSKTSKHSGGNMKVEPDLFYYATKTILNLLTSKNLQPNLN